MQEQEVSSTNLKFIILQQVLLTPWAMLKWDGRVPALEGSQNKAH